MKNNTSGKQNILRGNLYQQFEAFDQLPKSLRKLFHEGPFNYGAQQILGLRKKRMKVDKIKAIIETARVRDLKCPIDGTAAVYGPNHPEARS